MLLESSGFNQISQKFFGNMLSVMLFFSSIDRLLLSPISSLLMRYFMILLHIMTISRYLDALCLPPQLFKGARNLMLMPPNASFLVTNKESKVMLLCTLLLGKSSSLEIFISMKIHFPSIIPLLQRPSTYPRFLIMTYHS